MVQQMQDISNIAVAREQKMCKGLKQMDVATLSPHIIRSSAMFQSEQKMTPRARKWVISIKSFSDASFYPKMFHFDEAFKQFNSDDEPPPHNDIAANDNDITTTAFFNDRDAFETSPELRASHLYVQHMICSKT